MKQFSPVVLSSLFVLLTGACERHSKPAEPSPNMSVSDTTRTEDGANRTAANRTAANRTAANRTAAAPNDRALLTPASGPATKRTGERDSAGSGTAGRDKEDVAATSSSSPSADESNPPANALAPTVETPTRAPDVVFVPTPQPVVDKMLQLAKVSKNDVVYDLGCGDGRIVVTAAKRYGAKAYGFDIDPKRIAEARENVKRNGVGHLVTIGQADIFTLDLSPASVVTLYLLPRLNVKLIPQLEKLRPGSRIVSHDFDIQGVTPVQHLDVAAEDRSHGVYLWKTPLVRESGVMRSPSGS